MEHLEHLERLEHLEHLKKSPFTSVLAGLCLLLAGLLAFYSSILYEQYTNDMNLFNTSKKPNNIVKDGTQTRFGCKLCQPKPGDRLLSKNKSSLCLWCQHHFYMLDR